MNQTTSLIERALALAASGDYVTATQVRAALQAEGYPRAIVYPLIEGAAFRKTIRQLLKDAPRKAAKARPGDPGALSR